MIALTLKSLCSNVVIQWIFKILTLRKKEISSWKVDIHQWVDSMKLEKIRNCLLEYSINATFEDLLDKAIEQFKESRFHDILICCYHIFLSKSTLKLVVPECLIMDQYHRTYLLRIIGNYSGIRKIEFPCYYSWTFYVSEEEQNLIKAAFEKLEKLTFVKLPNVANTDILQVSTKTLGCYKNGKSMSEIYWTYFFLKKTPLIVCNTQRKKQYFLIEIRTTYLNPESGKI